MSNINVTGSPSWKPPPPVIVNMWCERDMRRFVEMSTWSGWYVNISGLQKRLMPTCTQATGLGSHSKHDHLAVQVLSTRLTFISVLCFHETPSLSLRLSRLAVSSESATMGTMWTAAATCWKRIALKGCDFPVICVNFTSYCETGLQITLWPFP